MALLTGYILGIEKSSSDWLKVLKKNLAVTNLFPHPHGPAKDTSIRLIDTLQEKQQLLADLGVDVLVIHPFSKEFSRQTADEFTHDVLVQSLISHI